MARTRVLVTGAAGQIGREFVHQLQRHSVRTIPTDVRISPMVRRMDVSDWAEVLETVRFFEPDLIVHLAAAKDAPSGERDPWTVARVNVDGTRNVLQTGVPVVFASTCKAVEAQTAYGGSKLLGERMVLEHGGTVARFYNVPECGPNVVDAWRQQRLAGDPLQVTPCTRHLMYLSEAVALLAWACAFDSGRYRFATAGPTYMSDFAEHLHPGYPQTRVRPRRGDRLDEPAYGNHEWTEATAVKHIDRVHSWHD